MIRWLPRLPLRWWLVLSHGAAIGVPVVALWASGTLGADLRNQTRWDLEHQGALLGLLVASELDHARRADPSAGLGDVAAALGPRLVEAKQQTLSGVRVVDANGVVVATSGALVGENLRGQAEVDQALSGRVGLEIRPRPEPSTLQPLSSESRRANVRLYVAVPVLVDGQVVGAIVLSRTPREELQALVRDMGPGVGLAGVAGVLGAIGFSALAAWVATRSLQELGRGANRIADGDFGGLESLERPGRSRVAEVASTASAVSTMALRLRERLAYIGEFASNVSHEFKTPIATLRGTLELLADDDAMPEAQRRRFLTNGEQEVERLQRLVDGLLELARADEAHAIAEVPLGPVLALVAERTGAALVGTAGTVRGDPAQLEAVVTNLVRNARIHGGPAARITVRAFDGPTSTGFEVEDDGPGISPANVPRVFERFFTTRREGGGTGLGLALVRTITRRHGGDTTVRSAPGCTVFRVELPRSRT